MSEWPEPTPEPGETAQRWVIGVLVVGAALLLWNARGSDNARGFNFAMPNISLPEFSLPEISLPNVSLPELDLRGRETQSADVPATASISESAIPLPFEDGLPVQNIPFETCIAMIEDFPSSTGDAIVVEDSADRRVRRYKFLEGNLTLTCSRTDNTLTIEQP